MESQRRNSATGGQDVDEPNATAGTAQTNPDGTLNVLAQDMFKKTSDYLQGELLLVMEDYKLLENLNKATSAKYSDMRQISGNIAKNLNDLNEKYKSLEPLLRQIDQIEDSVNKLEQAAYKLDSYSKRLEVKFKALEKRP